MTKQEIHDLRNELTKINRHILLARTYCTQPTVLEILDRTISDICTIGDQFGLKEKPKGDDYGMA